MERFLGVNCLLYILHTVFISFSLSAHAHIFKIKIYDYALCNILWPDFLSECNEYFYSLKSYLEDKLYFILYELTLNKKNALSLHFSIKNEKIFVHPPHVK